MSASQIRLLGDRMGGQQVLMSPKKEVCATYVSTDVPTYLTYLPNLGKCLRCPPSCLVTIGSKKWAMKLEDGAKLGLHNISWFGTHPEKHILHMAGSEQVFKKNQALGASRWRAAENF